MRNRIYILSILIVLTIILAITSCERAEPVSAGVDCTECYQDKPEWVQLTAEVTINAENPYVPLTIYVGDYENGQVDWTDTTWKSEYWVDVKPDRYYSVVAKYKDGSKIIYAVDGDDIKLKRSNSDCDAECYYQKGGYIDVRLRN
ncbi:MAG TPA: hypothetical protein P5514_05570 [Bacteroidales bacterium]|nr:hypothetical protein [Bacteroidales bacterium]HRX96394.1 hypothetical protein [Bacteroidales bacterium]